MQKHYKEKALLATEYKIEKLKKESDFFRRNVVKVILFGIMFSIWAPSYTDDYGRMIMQRLEMTYWQSVMVVSIFYIIFCLLGHFVWSFQEKNQLKRLLKRKSELENELKNMTD